ncbi:hypothetical protein ACHAPA_003784 [Fusarium lateritium]
MVNSQSSFTGNVRVPPQAVTMYVPPQAGTMRDPPMGNVQAAFAYNNQAAFAYNNQAAFAYNNQAAFVNNNNIAVMNNIPNYSVGNHMSNNQFPPMDDMQSAYMRDNEIDSMCNNQATFMYNNQAAFVNNNQAAFANNNQAAFANNNQAAFTYNNQATFTNNNQAAFAYNNQAAFVNNNNVAVIDNMPNYSVGNHMSNNQFPPMDDMQSPYMGNNEVDFMDVNNAARQQRFQLRPDAKAFVPSQRQHPQAVQMHQRSKVVAPKGNARAKGVTKQPAKRAAKQPAKQPVKGGHIKPRDSQSVAEQLSSGFLPTPPDSSPPASPPPAPSASAVDLPVPAKKVTKKVTKKTKSKQEDKAKLVDEAEIAGIPIPPSQRRMITLQNNDSRIIVQNGIRRPPAPDDYNVYFVDTNVPPHVELDTISKCFEQQRVPKPPSEVVTSKKKRPVTATQLYQVALQHALDENERDDESDSDEISTSQPPNAQSQAIPAAQAIPDENFTVQPLASQSTPAAQPIPDESDESFTAQLPPVDEFMLGHTSDSGSGSQPSPALEGFPQVNDLESQEAISNEVNDPDSQGAISKTAEQELDDAFRQHFVPSSLGPEIDHQLSSAEVQRLVNEWYPPPTASSGSTICPYTGIDLRPLQQFNDNEITSDQVAQPEIDSSLTNPVVEDSHVSEPQPEMVLSNSHSPHPTSHESAFEDA